MAIPLYFALWKLVFDSIDLLTTAGKKHLIRRSKGDSEDLPKYRITRFLSRTVATIVFAIAAWVVVAYIPDHASYMVGSLFLVISFLGCVLTAADERGLGITDITWYSILAGTCGLLIYFDAGSLVPARPVSGNIEYLKTVHSESQTLASKSIDLITIAGSILAVCMTILFGKGQWNDSSLDARLKHAGNVGLAAKMITAFFAIAGSVLTWVTWPLYLTLCSAREMLK